jgi:hypothetical protein
MAVSIGSKPKAAAGTSAAVAFARVVPGGSIAKLSGAELIAPALASEQLVRAQGAAGAHAAPRPQPRFEIA